MLSITLSVAPKAIKRCAFSCPYIGVVRASVGVLPRVVRRRLHRISFFYCFCFSPAIANKTRCGRRSAKHHSLAENRAMYLEIHPQRRPQSIDMPPSSFPPATPGFPVAKLFPCNDNGDCNSQVNHIRSTVFLRVLYAWTKGVRDRTSNSTFSGPQGCLQLWLSSDRRLPLQLLLLLLLLC